MPGYTAFLKGFDIYPRLILDDYQLVKIRINHNVIVQYHEYHYYIMLTFKYVGDHFIDRSKFLSKLKKHVRGYEIINSEYGNPYRCHFGRPIMVDEYDDTIVVMSVGKAVRI